MVIDEYSGKPQTTERSDDPEATLLDRARRYAETVPIDIDPAAVTWELSRRAKRRAGACQYDGRTGTVTIRLTWDAYREHSWEEFTGVIRHELVHAWEFQHFDESGHGERFYEKAASIDAPRYCTPFSEPRLRLVCTAPDCDWTAGRFRASSTVTTPEKRRCGNCGARYVVEHLASGERWRDQDGYRRARDRIGGGW